MGISGVINLFKRPKGVEKDKQKDVSTETLANTHIISSENADINTQPCKPFVPKLGDPFTGIPDRQKSNAKVRKLLGISKDFTIERIIREQNEESAHRAMFSDTYNSPRVNIASDAGDKAYDDITKTRSRSFDHTVNTIPNFLGHVEIGSNIFSNDSLHQSSGRDYYIQDGINTENIKTKTKRRSASVSYKTSNSGISTFTKGKSKSKGKGKGKGKDKGKAKGEGNVNKALAQKDIDTFKEFVANGKHPGSTDGYYIPPDSLIASLANDTVFQNSTENITSAMKNSPFSQNQKRRVQKNNTNVSSSFNTQNFRGVTNTSREKYRSVKISVEILEKNIEKTLTNDDVIKYESDRDRFQLSFSQLQINTFSADLLSGISPQDRSLNESTVLGGLPKVGTYAEEGLYVIGHKRDKVSNTANSDLNILSFSETLNSDINYLNQVPNSINDNIQIHRFSILSHSQDSYSEKIMDTDEDDVGMVKKNMFNETNSYLDSDFFFEKSAVKSRTTPTNKKKLYHHYNYTVPEKVGREHNRCDMRNQNHISKSSKSSKGSKLDSLLQMTGQRLLLKNKKYKDTVRDNLETQNNKCSQIPHSVDKYVDKSDGDYEDEEEEEDDDDDYNYKYAQTQRLFGIKTPVTSKSTKHTSGYQEQLQAKNTIIVNRDNNTKLPHAFLASVEDNADYISLSEVDSDDSMAVQDYTRYNSNLATINSKNTHVKKTQLVLQNNNIKMRNGKDGKVDKGGDADSKMNTVGSCEVSGSDIGSSDSSGSDSSESDIIIDDEEDANINMDENNPQNNAIQYPASNINAGGSDNSNAEYVRIQTAESRNSKGRAFSFNNSSSSSDNGTKTRVDIESAVILPDVQNKPTPICGSEEGSTLSVKNNTEGQEDFAELPPLPPVKNVDFSKQTESKGKGAQNIGKINTFSNGANLEAVGIHNSNATQALQDTKYQDEFISSEKAASTESDISIPETKSGDSASKVKLKGILKNKTEKLEGSEIDEPKQNIDSLKKIDPVRSRVRFGGTASTQPSQNNHEPHSVIYPNYTAHQIQNLKYAVASENYPIVINPNTQNNTAMYQQRIMSFVGNDDFKAMPNQRDSYFEHQLNSGQPKYLYHPTTRIHRASAYPVFVNDVNQANSIGCSYPENYGYLENRGINVHKKSENNTLQAAAYYNYNGIVLPIYPNIENKDMYYSGVGANMNAGSMDRSIMPNNGNPGNIYPNVVQFRNPVHLGHQTSKKVVSHNQFQNLVFVQQDRRHSVHQNALTYHASTNTAAFPQKILNERHFINKYAAAKGHGGKSKITL